MRLSNLVLAGFVASGLGAAFAPQPPSHNNLLPVVGHATQQSHQEDSHASYGQSSKNSQKKDQSSKSGHSKQVSSHQDASSKFGQNFGHGQSVNNGGHSSNHAGQGDEKQPSKSGQNHGFSGQPFHPNNPIQPGNNGNNGNNQQVKSSTSSSKHSSTTSTRRTSTSTVSSARSSSTSSTRASSTIGRVVSSSTRRSSSTGRTSTSTGRASTSAGRTSTSTGRASSSTARVSTSSGRTSSSSTHASSSTRRVSSSTGRSTTSTARVSTSAGRASSSTTSTARGASTSTGRASSSARGSTTTSVSSRASSSTASSAPVSSSSSSSSGVFSALSTSSSTALSTSLSSSGISTISTTASTSSSASGTISTSSSTSVSASSSDSASTDSSSVSVSTTATISSIGTSSTITSSISASATNSTTSASSTISSSSTSSAVLAACTGNSASTRDAWCDFSIDTDYSLEAPDTGVTREYWLDLTDVTVSPDGVSRTAMAINGSIPGPTIFADWGDTVIVHVTNSLTSSTNGTSIHWHGIRQNYTNPHDGVSAITQCPTAPGQTTTYKWRAVQYGSSWYHSHFALQAWQGVFGGIIINGPATANYDEDLGLLFLNDWDHQTVDELYVTAQFQGPPTLDNGLINGTNVYGEDGDGQVGERFKMSLQPGTSYRLRIVNAAIDTHWKFSIDNHSLKVIASDFVPIVPYDADIVSIGMGQRYDLIITADQEAVADSFWMRAIPQAACSENDSTDNIKGIVYYGDSTTEPTTTGYTYTDACDDETDNIVPHIAKSVDEATWTDVVAAGLTFPQGFVKWTINSTSMLVDWADPTLLQIYNNESTYENSQAVYQLNEANKWIYFVIETTFGITHPIHLHGHDFMILAQGTGTFSSNTTLNLANPPRRDVAMLPASGYLAMAFETDNPGAWLMHCHIGWHTSEGFAVQFVERYSEIQGLFDSSVDIADSCSTWKNFQSSVGLTQEDSGI